MKIKRLNLIILTACTLLAVSVFTFWGYEGKERQAFYCKKALSGDKLIVFDGRKEQVVRLVGVDAPDLSGEPGEPDEFYSQEALGYLKERVEGQELYLEFAEPKLDVFNQWRAYVYLPDGAFLNLELIKQGWAAVFNYYQFSERREFLIAQHQAQQSRRGMWQGWTGRFSVIGRKATP